MHVLITGFPPFPNQPVNTTQQLVDAIRGGLLSVPGIELSAELLPVEYRGVERAFHEILNELQPDVVLSFGVGRQSSLLRLERIGRNLDHASIPDNAGEYRTHHEILPGCPETYFSQLNLISLAAALEVQGVSVELSDNAGAYVCNHLNYLGMHLSSMAEKPFPFLFTHTSSIGNGFDMDLALVGVEAMLNWFIVRNQ